LLGDFIPAFSFFLVQKVGTIIERRLVINRKQPELTTQDMENFAIALKKKTLSIGGLIIDSSGDIIEPVERIIDSIEEVRENQISLTINTAQSLIKEQFPQRAHLKIKHVKYKGQNNAMFHLGTDMLIRLPMGATYALKVHKEQMLLHKFAKTISIPIPKPITIGNPSKNYPWHWSIYNYIDGESAASIKLSPHALENIAQDLASFLNELQRIDTKNAPIPGLHNYWRGEHTSVYECGALRYFEQLKNVIDSKKACVLWTKASSTKWLKPPVWIHGDLASGNILIENEKLAAVIDFGACAIGDPACDLSIAFTLFNDKSRQIFKHNLNLDEDTWLRAQAWALWKSGYELVNIKNKSSPAAQKHISIINDIASSHL